ncbi:cell division/cell wall cluster transcriptional repressor MraZ [Psychromonas sp. psych-6C06]|uniref:division/cell wall cluster transcriptional repressor MraZ n=1 Tax=Psychromonas sp. psych-6C06 TaxID=2058089 RepID=UPI000C34E29E|nr:division/cell wall cluster transcriptional repressor MraZ [Psychromonas sp. psych-6C06]PKF62244.1 cell division/cell wall cluster transcriptional repressor MraZ [Psychromonas sp. psych-6C06]
MLRSANAINMDTKGRIAMPTRYRDSLLESCHGQFVCTIDLQSPCLLIYPLNEWLVIEKKLSALSSTNPIERRVQRLVLGYATETELDKGGRLLIAPTLRKHAKLEKKVMLVGQFNKFELWDEDMWQQQVEADLLEGLPAGELLTESLKGFSL